MKKQELIHLHGLLVEVAGRYEELTGRPVDDTAYRSLSVQPISVFESKDRHAEAVSLLATAVVEAIADEGREAPAPTA